jgi:hypothetical protein
MSDHDLMFAELRELVDPPPFTIQRWQALCAHIERWPLDAAVQIAIPYASAALVDYDPRWRDASHMWCVRLARGIPQPWMVLARSMRLIGMNIEDRHVQRLVASPDLRELRSVSLAHNKISDEGAVQIAASAHLSAVERLDLSTNDIGPEGARALLESGRLSSLTALDLSENPLGDEGIASLARSPRLLRLRELGISRCGGGDASALALAASPHTANLTALNLSWGDITDVGAYALADALAASSFMPRLERLYMVENHKMTEAGEGALREVLEARGVADVTLRNPLPPGVPTKPRIPPALDSFISRLLRPLRR